MFWKEFVALLVALSFSVKGWKFVTLAVPGGSPIGPPRAVLLEAFAALPKPKPPVVFVVVVLLPPNMLLPVVEAPKAGLFAEPKRPPPLVEAPPKGLEVEALVLLLLPKPPPKPLPAVVVVAPPNRLLPPVVVEVLPKAGFAPKALLLLLAADPKARETCVSKLVEVTSNCYDRGTKTGTGATDLNHRRSPGFHCRRCLLLLLPQYSRHRSQKGYCCWRRSHLLR